MGKEGKKKGKWETGLIYKLTIEEERRLTSIAVSGSNMGLVSISKRWVTNDRVSRISEMNKQKV